MRAAREPAVDVGGDVDIAAVGALVADRARSRILLALHTGVLPAGGMLLDDGALPDGTFLDRGGLLDGGQTLPASRLAAAAGIGPATARGHLDILTGAGLLAVETREGVPHYRLASPAVGLLVEALRRLAPAVPRRSPGNDRARAMRDARTCHDHLAGRVGVAIMASMLERGYLTRRNRTGGSTGSAVDDDVDYELTAAGHDFLTGFGLAPPRGPLPYCIDWTEQRHHLRGPCGRRLLSRVLELGWVRGTETGRAIRVTEEGRAGLARTFGIDPGIDTGVGFGVDADA